jgi:hypothetical protein
MKRFPLPAAFQDRCVSLFASMRAKVGQHILLVAAAGLTVTFLTA